MPVIYAIRYAGGLRARFPDILSPDQMYGVMENEG